MNDQVQYSESSSTQLSWIPRNETVMLTSQPALGIVFWGEMHRRFLLLYVMMRERTLFRFAHRCQFHSERSR